MEFTPASSGSVAAFVLLVVLVLTAILFAIHHAYRASDLNAGRATTITAAVLVVWIAGWTVLVASGQMLRLPLYGLPFFFGGIIVVSVGFGLSRAGGRIATHVPLAFLVGFQVFRLPLELVLHRWFKDGTIPETMTWTGQNWDIAS